jgi:flagellar biosynthesis protein FlhG
LRAIEEENFGAAPSPVYLRGFLKTVARDLKLDPEQVARTYMRRFELSGLLPSSR